MNTGTISLSDISSVALFFFHVIIRIYLHEDDFLCIQIEQFYIPGDDLLKTKLQNDDKRPKLKTRCEKGQKD